MQRLRSLIPLLILVSTAACSHQQARVEPDQSHLLKPPSQKFQQLSRLEGRWKGHKNGSQGPEAVEVSYQITSGGSALIETLFPNSSHEMVSVYYENNGKLEMTHYCGLGNQPHLSSANGLTAGKIDFTYASGTNINSVKEPHMHALTITFIGDDKIRHEWQYFAGGKLASTEVFELSRVKSF